MKTTRRRFMRGAIAGMSAAGLALSMAACSGKTAGGDDTAKDKADGAITITAENGTVNLDAPAVNVVALEWTYIEDFLAMGITPIAVADIEGYNTWVTAGERLPEGVIDVGDRQAPDLEQLRTLEIDLIVTDADRGRDLVDGLEEIAPTAAFDFYKHKDGQYAGMRDVVTQLAAAIGKPEEGERVLGELDTTIEEGKKALAEADLEGAPYALSQGYTNEGTPEIRMFTDSAMSAETLNLLGLKNTWDGEADDFGMTTVGVESLTKLSDDTNFLYIAADADNPFTGALTKNDVWNELPFVVDGKALPLDPGTWVFGGPVSAQQIVTEAVAALTK